MRASAPNYKIVLLGEGRVGKTSLATRFVQGGFSDKQAASVQASFLSRKLVVDGRGVTLAIWDTAGQERFHALGPIYYRDADAALLVYDITDAATFERVKSWVKELHKMAPPSISLVIAANKSDLERQRRVSTEESQSYADAIGAAHFATSAKLNKGVEDAFLNIARDLLSKRAPDMGSSSGVKTRRVVIVDDDQLPQPPSAKTCCA
eukprot:jgi/Mesen1/9950/ME000071S09367